MAITAAQVKELRDKTQAGFMDCKAALSEAGGDLDKAITVLRTRGQARAAKRSGRSTSQGMVGSYIHMGGQVGVLIEVGCESDFVARTDDFKALAHDIAMQVAAMDPKYVDVADIPDGTDENPEQVCLLQQAFIKDPSKTVQDLVNEVVAKIGENIKVRRFSRFALGE